MKSSNPIRELGKWCCIVAFAWFAWTVPAEYLTAASKKTTRTPPRAVVGAEVYRRSLPAGSKVRVYRGTELVGETTITGDTRVTVQLGTVIPPPPVPVPVPPPIPDPPPPTPDPPVPPPVPVPTEGWYVSPTGLATGDGTQARPWSLESAVNVTHRTRLSGGGTVWLLPGTYRKSPNPEGLGFRCVVGGTSANPLVFRAVPGARVTLDGGFSFFAGSNHTWLWGVEILVSEAKPHGTSGSWPAGSPGGGVNFYTSTGCKAINCVLKENRQGASVWTEARDAEVYGCLIYDNGWVGTDRAHGHGVYVQNPASTGKRVVDNIFTARHSRGWRDGRYTLHGYGERVEVTNVIAEGNLQAGVNDAFLLGAGATGPGSTGHRMINNAIYGVRVRIGRTPTQPLEFKGNVIGGQLELVGSGPLTNTGNVVSPPEPRPTSPSVILRPNKYEPGRAHLMLIDWQRRGRVLWQPTGWAQAGERLRILDATDSYGTPIWSGVVPAGGVDLAVTDAKVFLVLKEGALPGTVIREEAPVMPRLR